MVHYCAYPPGFLSSLRFWSDNSSPTAFLVVFSGKAGLPFDQRCKRKMIFLNARFYRNITIVYSHMNCSFFQLDIRDHAR